jgi:hypothetical protein
LWHIVSDLGTTKLYQAGVQKEVAIIQIIMAENQSLRKPPF